MSSQRPCTRISKKSGKACHCLDFIKRDDSDRCDSCQHSGRKHLSIFTSSSSLSTDPPPPSQPGASSPAEPSEQSSSSRVQQIVTNSLSASSKSFLAKASDEIRSGMRGITHASPHVSSSKSSGTKQGKINDTKVTTSVSKQEVSKPVSFKKVAGIILNIHGIDSFPEGEQLRVNVVYAKANIDFQKALGIAYAPRDGVNIDPDLDHPRLVTSLLEYLPVMRHLYIDHTPTDRTPWVVCTQHYSTLIVSPFKFPAAFDIYAKRSLTSRSWNQQWIYLASHDPISKDVVARYCKERPADFERMWITLGKQEKWFNEDISEAQDQDPSDSNDDEVSVAVVGAKRKRRQSDDTAKTPRRSPRFASTAYNLSSEKELGKGKAREILSPIESNDEMEGDSDIEEVFTSLLPSSPDDAGSFDPWNPNRRFLL